jgi:hypothetical protein
MLTRNLHLNYGWMLTKLETNLEKHSTNVVKIVAAHETSCYFVVWII